MISVKISWPAADGVVPLPASTIGSPPAPVVPPLPGLPPAPLPAAPPLPVTPPFPLGAPPAPVSGATSTFCTSARKQPGAVEVAIAIQSKAAQPARPAIPERPALERPGDFTTRSRRHRGAHDGDV